mmetsp:Transcript_5907/g.12947  ORF Transcript_5907/g.12947 Transcript_5907/m.12947 type:complete len:83 (-) Transcript_5907:56-304(-)
MDIFGAGRTLLDADDAKDGMDADANVMTVRAIPNAIVLMEVMEVLIDELRWELLTTIKTKIIAWRVLSWQIHQSQSCGKSVS